MVTAGRPSEKGRTVRNNQLEFHAVYLGVSSYRIYIVLGMTGS